MTAILALLVLAPPSPTICIDPGHPSEVGRGTKGKRLTEVEVAWRVALGLKETLERDGYTVVLTKDSVNQFVSNKRRAEIANEHRASLMVRLHCDATGGTGFAVYHPSKAGRSREGVSGPSRTVLRGSGILAKTFHAAMASELKGHLRDNGLRTDLQTAIGSRQGALTGSIYSRVPVLLVEMAVLTNPKDEAFLASAAGERRMVSALARGVREAVPLARL